MLAAMSDHPRTIDGMADEAEAELRRLVAEKQPNASVEVDPEAGDGCLVEIRKEGRRIAHWYGPRRFEAVSDALEAVRAGALDR